MHRSRHLATLAATYAAKCWSTGTFAASRLARDDRHDESPNSRIPRRSSRKNDAMNVYRRDVIVLDDDFTANKATNRFFLLAYHSRGRRESFPDDAITVSFTFACSRSVDRDDIVEKSDYHNSIFSERMSQPTSRTGNGRRGDYQRNRSDLHKIGQDHHASIQRA